ncbi:putative phosphotransferase [Legionella lansingensis]|uniref:Putative phosphotransferase n=1 Tax=Legionella lansingensis TaxID=45067 RepID=A0A0W0VLP3_9GAMM|nr:phosphotransferase [Legionella lansingensis]KTD21009.1 putative phosphotransferase [Legionella lansingensis]SNV44959.1 putative phosphotransferase [Legionella lansingensis]
MQNRQNALSKWLEQTLKLDHIYLSPLSGDASFRRYFRLKTNGITQVVMDAPPQKEALEPFLAVSELLLNLGVDAPKVHRLDKVQGFAILDDFGDELLLSHLSLKSADRLYAAATSIILLMQQCPSENTARLPCFDKQFMLQELAIFREWFLQAYLNVRLSPSEEQLLTTTFNDLTDEISEQPQVFIHRDYHSRNIMLLSGEEPIRLGVIDFQDAMRGPFTYDLVSLLKDCYIQWPCDQVRTWLTSFYEQSSLAQQWSLAAFTRAFDLCGLQRHLKVLGVFSRLHLRDNKPNYLRDLPLTLHYVMSCLEGYKDLEPFFQFVQERIRLP